jgi:hypothetical protein
MMFFGVDSPEDIPSIPENAMLFMEEIYTVTIGGTSYVYGKTIVMDSNKYCIYTFKGVSFGVSGLPHDYSVTGGYVYNVNDVEDYNGLFAGASFNEITQISGGAVAMNGVYSEILSGVGYGSASIGVSITHYDTPYGDWIYGEADIGWYDNVYNYYTPSYQGPSHA